MLKMTHPYETHVVRADGTSYTHSQHKSVEGAVRYARELKRMHDRATGAYKPRSTQVWTARDNKHHSVEDFVQAVERKIYS